MRVFILILVITLCCFSKTVYGQVLYSRVEADISIKEIYPSGKKSIMIGKVFFDIKEQQIVYNIMFPEKEIMIVRDTAVYSLKSGLVKSRPSSPEFLKFSIYNLLLNGDLKFFGLDQSKFVIGNIEQTGNGNVQSEWLPKNPDIKVKILVSQKDQLIDGIAMVGENGVMASKQLFSDYEQVGRVSFPMSIYELNQLPDGEYKKLTNHKNLKFNDYSDEIDLYNPDIISPVPD